MHAALANVQTLLANQWTDPERRRIPFRTYATQWLDNNVAVRPRTRDVYASLLKRHLLPGFGERPFGTTAEEAVRRWYAALHRRHPATARSAYRVLRAIFNTAVEDRRIGHNPCRVRGAGTDRAEGRLVPKRVEVEKLILALPDKLKMAAMLAAGGGLRRGEVLGMQRRDIDLERALIHIRRALQEPSDGLLTYGPTKNGESRSVHVSDDLVEALSVHLERFVESDPAAPLFTGRTGERLRPSSLEYFWRKARRSTGLTHIRFHDLRHCHATEYSAAGASLGEVMARGGWKSPSMVARYQHATPERDAQLARSLPPLISTSENTDVDAEGAIAQGVPKPGGTP